MELACRGVELACRVVELASGGVELACRRLEQGGKYVDVKHVLRGERREVRRGEV